MALPVFRVWSLLTLVSVGSAFFLSSPILSPKSSLVMRSSTLTNDQLVSFTEDAVAQIQKMRSSQQDILRVGVRAEGGCAEYSYTVDVCSSPNQDDLVHETSHGFCLVIDQDSVPFLNGVEMTYQNDAFLFKNPNAASSCNCGNSFTLRKELRTKPSESN